MFPENIEIDLSTDGAKVDKGMDQFWPQQYRIFNIAHKRSIMAGFFQGRHKPSNPFAFYEQFDDAPAKAFVLNHYGHNSSILDQNAKLKLWKVI